MAIKVDVQRGVDYAEAADALLPGHRARDAQRAPIAIASAISTPWESAASSLDPAFRMRCSKRVQFG